MKRLTCEICGSTDLVKDNGVFVCQSCGCKYSVEEARKMMIEGTVDVRGTVRIDHSDELQKLYQAARNARETSDDESALRHYESISAKDPNSWEALFYLVVLKTNSIKNSEIASAAVSVYSSLPKVFSLINETISDPQEKKAVVEEVIQQCLETATWLTSASHNFYKSMTQGNGLMAITGLFGAITSAGSTLSALTEDTNRCVTIANIMCYCGLYIEEEFDMEDPDYCGYAVWSWQKMLEFHDDYHKVHSTQVLFNDESLNRFNGKIRQYQAKLQQQQAQTAAREQAQQAEQARLEQEAAKQRHDAYWAEHWEEAQQLRTQKAELTEKRSALAGQITALLKQIREAEAEDKTVVPSEIALQELSDQIRELSDRRAGLGMFAGKEKKQLGEQIAELENRKPGLRSKIAGEKTDRAIALMQKSAQLKSEKDALNAELTAVTRQIVAIDAELTKPRD